MFSNRMDFHGQPTISKKILLGRVVTMCLLLVDVAEASRHSTLPSPSQPVKSLPTHSSSGKGLDQDIDIDIHTDPSIEALAHQGITVTQSCPENPPVQCTLSECQGSLVDNDNDNSTGRSRYQCTSKTALLHIRTPAMVYTTLFECQCCPLPVTEQHCEDVDCLGSNSGPGSSLDRVCTTYKLLGCPCRSSDQGVGDGVGEMVMEVFDGAEAIVDPASPAAEIGEQSDYPPQVITFASISTTTVPVPQATYVPERHGHGHGQDPGVRGHTMGFDGVNQTGGIVFQYLPIIHSWHN